MEYKYENYIDCSEAIARYLVRSVPQAWRLIEAFIKIDHEVDMVTTEIIYYPAEINAEKEWFSIEDGEEDLEFGDCFIQLARFVSTPDKGLFKKCVFVLDRDGKYRTEYEY